jgi:hypothetical protein
MRIGAPPPSAVLHHRRARCRRHRRRRGRASRPGVGSGLRRPQRLRRGLAGRHRRGRLRPGARARRVLRGHRGRVVLERRRRLAPRRGRGVRLVSRGRWRRRRPDGLHLPLPGTERRPPPRHARPRVHPLEQRGHDHPDHRQLRDRHGRPDDTGRGADHLRFRRGRKTGGGRSKSRRSRQAPQAREYAPGRPPSTRTGPRPPPAPCRPDGESQRASWP